MMRIGLAQAFWLDVPEFAAVDTSVALAPRPLRGLVNAVLRGQIATAPRRVTPDTLAPPWLLARWRAAYRKRCGQRDRRLIAEEPATDLTLRPDAESRRWPRRSDGEAPPGGGLRTARRGDHRLAGLTPKARWWVQDAAAALPPGCSRRSRRDACSISAPRRAARPCSSPPPARASTRSTVRPRGSRQLTDNLGAPASPPRRSPPTRRLARRAPLRRRAARRPCSATGTFRRHPDVLWNARPADIAALARVQAGLLDAAAARLRPGGRLVYSVCSLEPEEGEDSGPRLPRPPAGLIVDPHRPRRRRRAAGQPRARGLAAHPAAPSPRAAATASSSPACGVLVEPLSPCPPRSIAPSILSADFARLGEEARAVGRPRAPTGCTWT